MDGLDLALRFRNRRSSSKLLSRSSG
jgi:hypothetical protein